MEDFFEYVFFDGVEFFVVVEFESLFIEILKFIKVINGLNIVGIVFGIVGFVIIIGLGVWILEKFDDVIDEVNKK